MLQNEILRRILPAIVLAGIAAVCPAQAPSPSSFAIVHVNVISMDKPGVLRDQTVLVTGRTIRHVGPSSSVTGPKAAQIIQGNGRYLMPGLTDSHVHLLSRTELPLYLGNGVTTVINLEGRPAHLAWRKEATEDKLLGPNIFTCGPLFDRRRTPEAAVKEVDDQADAGYDCIKVFEQVSQAEFPALTAEAKKRGLPLVGHVARKVGYDVTIAAGQSIAHADEIIYTYFNPQQDNKIDHVVLDESKLSALARETAAAGVFLMPTMCTFRAEVLQKTDLPHFLQNPDLTYLAPWTRQRLDEKNNYFHNHFKDADVPRIQEFLAFEPRIVAAFQKAGVPLLAGTDSTDIGPVAGFSIHDELSELVNSGLTPYQALQTATTNPTRFLRAEGKFGAVHEGAQADLLLLEKNPLDDIRNTRLIAGEMLRGQWFDQKELHAMLEGRAAAYQQDLAQAEHMLADDPGHAEVYFRDSDPFERVLGAAFTDIATRQGGAAVGAALKALREHDSKSRLVSEGAVNAMGYALLGSKLDEAALAVFRLNTEFYAESANTYDSLAEAYFNTGDTTSAVRSYSRALEIDPKYPNAEFANKFVAEHQSH